MILLLLAMTVVTPAASNVTTYEGPWNTTKNRKLNGIMTAVVTDLGNNQWKGRFYGTWQGVDFEYTVKFTGMPGKLKGEATIDGAHYHWTGEFGQQTPDWFNGTFESPRYDGYFQLKEKK